MGAPIILVVEDSRPQAETIKGFLENSGYEVFTADDGKSAIKQAVSGKVDLILLDLLLPDMSGVEVCRWLKINQSTRMIPILMLTAKGEVADKVSGFEAGADDYLSKPYSEMELNARIYALLRTKTLQDELREKNERLQELLAKVELLAITDPLTKLYNRRHMEDYIRRELKAASRYHSPLSLLMIDIDHFKSINDEFGHGAGDTVLREVSGLIKDSVREVDTVARWGGEEFLVLLPRCDKKEALESADRIINRISQHSFSPIPGKRLTVSVGVSGVPDSFIDNTDMLIDASDRAMYAAKKKGRNRAEAA